MHFCCCIWRYVCVCVRSAYGWIGIVVGCTLIQANKCTCKPRSVPFRSLTEYNFKYIDIAIYCYYWSSEQREYCNTVLSSVENESYPTHVLEILCPNLSEYGQKHVLWKIGQNWKCCPSYPQMSRDSDIDHFRIACKIMESNTIIRRVSIPLKCHCNAYALIIDAEEVEGKWKKDSSNEKEIRNVWSKCCSQRLPMNKRQYRGLRFQSIQPFSYIALPITFLRYLKIDRKHTQFYRLERVIIQSSYNPIAAINT